MCPVFMSVVADYRLVYGQFTSTQLSVLLTWIMLTRSATSIAYTVGATYA